MNSTSLYHGACLCGAIKLEISSEPIWTGHCHCPSCQKATSAGFATYAGFDKSAVLVKGDEPKVYKSSPGVIRRFCGKCGSPVSFEGETWPGEIHLHAALLKEAIDLKPEGHTYVRTKMPWVHLDDGLTQYDTFPEKDY